MKKKFRVVKNFKIIKRSCSLNKYYRVGLDHNKDGCDSFLPTLRRNGLCHIINGQKTLKTWKKANITTEFDDLFPKNHSVEYFQGGGATEGSYYLL